MKHEIGLAGDWHGSRTWGVQSIAAFARAGVDHVYQLGDFGLGWPGPWGQYINEIAGACIKHKVFLEIIPGNHENYDWIAARLDGQKPEDGVVHITSYIRILPRGFRVEHSHGRTLVALGGAPSIDFFMRTEGIDWWKEEQLKLEEVEAVAAAGHADIMLTHDAPSTSTDEVMGIINSNPQGWPPQAIAYASEGRQLMDIAFQGVQPKFFAHGHFHIAGEKKIGDTQFVSLDMNYPWSKRTDRSNVIINLEDLSWDWLDIND